MRVAVIDLGANSLRFEIHELSKSGNDTRLYRERLMLRLGEPVFQDGSLDSSAIRRTLSAFRGFKPLLSQYKVERILAYGTSALRNALNGEDLIRKVRKETGIPLTVISTQEESRLTTRGILAFERKLRKPFAIVDIGGGSVEINLCLKTGNESAGSYPLGLLRLKQSFFSGEKINPARALIHARKYISCVLQPQLLAYRSRRLRTLVVSGGTPRVIFRLMRRWKGSGPILSLKQLKELQRELSGLTPARALRLPGMDRERIDLIMPCLLVLIECMKALGTTQAKVTDFAMKEGMLVEFYRFRKLRPPQSWDAQLDRAKDLMTMLRSDSAHWKAVHAISVELFDRLTRIHGLSGKWKSFLLASAILHDSGQAISFIHHEKHSGYIVENADFPSLDPHDRLFVAALCRLHHGAKTYSEKEIDFCQDRKERKVFLKLLALLRVADALDCGSQARLSLTQITPGRLKIHLRFHASRAPELELMMLEQKKALFEHVFGRKLEVDIHS